MKGTILSVFSVLISIFQPGCSTSLQSWNDWWVYHGVSGPDNWNMNPDWHMCSDGRQQSPIDINPDHLLFDPRLKRLEVDKHSVVATLHNQGQSLVVRLDEHGHSDIYKRKRGIKTGHGHGHNYLHVTVSGGPLSYRYRLQEAYIHYGFRDSEGSEHRIHNASYPGEIQFYGYNDDLCSNMTEAAVTTHGIVAISVMLQVKKGDPNPELFNITNVVDQVQYKGQRSDPFVLTIHDLLPRTASYMTYEGSVTMPGCWETVTWVIINKPIYITNKELSLLRRVSQQVPGRDRVAQSGNTRPLQPLNNRVIRTNIDFPQQSARKCATMQRTKKYQANTGRHPVHHPTNRRGKPGGLSPDGSPSLYG